MPEKGGRTKGTEIAGEMKNGGRSAETGGLKQEAEIEMCLERGTTEKNKNMIKYGNPHSADAFYRFRQCLSSAGDRAQTRRCYIEAERIALFFFGLLW